MLVSDSTDETAQARLEGGRRDPRRLRARRAGLRAAPRGRRARPRPERPAAAAGRVAPAREHRELARRRASHAEALLDAAARCGPAHGRRSPRELRRGGWLASPGWLPAAAVAERRGRSRWLTPAGSSRARRAAIRLARPRRRHAAARRPRQADPLRDPRAGPRRRRVPRPVRGQRRRRHRGAVARRGAATFVEKDQGAVAVDRRQPRGDRPCRPAARVIRWDVVRWLRGEPARRRAVRPRPRRSALRRDRAPRRASWSPRGRGRAARARCAGSSPSTSGATRRPTGSVC